MNKEAIAIKALDACGFPTDKTVSAELRRMNALNQELVEALNTTLENLIEWGACDSLYEREKYGLQGDILMAKAVLAKACAAIAKGEQS